MNTQSNINTGLSAQQTLPGFPGETLPLSGLTNDNLPQVAHAATHIQNFSWYHPASNDKVAQVKLMHPAPAELLITSTTRVVDPVEEIVIAPISQPKSMPKEEVASIPLRNSVSETVSNVADNLFEKAQADIRALKKNSHLVSEASKKAVDDVNRSVDAALSQFEDRDLTKYNQMLELEEAERADRMANGPNSVLLGKFHKFVHPYIVNSSYSKKLPAMSAKSSNIVADATEKALLAVNNAVDAAMADVEKNLNLIESLLEPEDLSLSPEEEMLLAKEEIKKTASEFKLRRVPQWVNELEELERESRMLEGVNPILSGKFNHLIHPEIRNFSGMPSMFAKARRNAGQLAHNLVDRASDLVHAALVDNTPARFERSAESIGLGSGDLVDFDFRRRNFGDLSALEEAERALRMKSGINAVMAGKFNRFIFPEIRGLNRLPSYFAKARRNATVAVAEFVEKAKEIVAESIPETPARFEKSGASIGLGFGDKVDFSLKRRVPSEILAAEEKERAERIALGVDPILLGKHRQYVLRPLMGYRWALPKLHVLKPITAALPAVHLPSALPAVHLPSAQAVKETASSWTHFAGSLLGSAAHYVHDMADAARAQVGLASVDTSSLSYLEEKERVRRLNATVDPVMDARKRHVEQQLLHEIKRAN